MHLETTGVFWYCSLPHYLETGVAVLETDFLRYSRGVPYHWARSRPSNPKLFLNIK